VRLTDGRKVRFIGINTPERDEPFHDEATELTRQLLRAGEVRLAFDAEPKDQYGRDLAYLFRDDGLLVNAEIVRQGLAYTYTWPPNTRYRDLLLRCQREARQARAGLWASEPAPAREYIWDDRHHFFHRPECRYAQRTRPEERRSSPDRDVPLDLGVNPCRECRP
jgi:micrococcal nuclease